MSRAGEIDAGVRMTPALGAAALAILGWTAGRSDLLNWQGTWDDDA